MFKIQQFLTFFHVCLGILEGFIFQGVSTAFYYFLNVLVENGHLCSSNVGSNANKTLPITNATNKIGNISDHNHALASAHMDLFTNFSKIQTCPEEFKDNSETKASIFILLGMLILNLGAVVFGFVSDRFRPLFVKIIIIFLFVTGFFLLSLLNFDNENFILQRVGGLDTYDLWL